MAINLREHQYKMVHEEAFNLFKKKNNDYGDAFANFGPTGVIMRMQDKMSRYIQVSKTKIELVEDEKIRDTIIDLHNYCAMAIMLMDEEENEKIRIFKLMNDEKNYLRYLDDDSDYTFEQNKSPKHILTHSTNNGYSFGSLSSMEVDSPVNNKVKKN